MDTDTRNLAFLLVLSAGVLIGSYMSERSYMYQQQKSLQERQVLLDTIQRLESQRNGLKTVIMTLKDREDIIVEKTLNDLGLGDHFKKIKEAVK